MAPPSLPREFGEMARKQSTSPTDRRPIPVTYVRAWRTFRGLTIERLAERAELSVATISDIEKGKVDFRGRTLLAIAIALETDPGSLLSRAPNDEELWSVFNRLGADDKPRAVALIRALETLGNKTP
jgi:transcriptional regulator with XRE-family HTH domain